MSVTTPLPVLLTLRLVVPEITPLTAIPPVLAALKSIRPWAEMESVFTRPLTVSRFAVVLTTEPPPFCRSKPRVKLTAAAPV